jgi:hypothetical protein
MNPELTAAIRTQLRAQVDGASGDTVIVPAQHLRALLGLADALACESVAMSGAAAVLALNPSCIKFEQRQSTGSGLPRYAVLVEGEELGTVSTNDYSRLLLIHRRLTTNIGELERRLHGIARDLSAVVEGL